MDIAPEIHQNNSSLNLKPKIMVSVTPTKRCTLVSDKELRRSTFCNCDRAVKGTW